MSAAHANEPVLRSEVDVAAEVIARLLSERVITRNQVGAAERAAGLMAGEAQAAVDRLRAYGWRPPARRATTEHVPRDPVQVHKNPVLHAVRAGRGGGRYAAKNPAPGRRICGHCDLELPIEEFDVKVRADARFHAWCRICMRIYQRARYVSNDLRDALETNGLALDLDERGRLAGLSCTVCGERLGDEGPVVPELAVRGWHHAGCTPPEHVATPGMRVVAR